ncbi:hypothetical protein GCM10009584_25800 [Ornithinimicrobium humiphilum]|uniref:Tryptophan-associated transmembrane protein n=1 Tax=Ornithinimicrobium humiphilum TaxID=125288 RepID=A0A543KPK6_9MICO|nr:Trp biosynthesis-associated membrane protein [Ornithinimicrobium humiphilum]TQM97002.1 tryptophan-associated transmembrane protein [Ornithinimicrobium humiphilum]
MSRRGAAALALLGCGLVLLASTQPWVGTVTEAAPGAPRTRGALGAAEIVPWLAPATLVCAAALVAGLAGLRAARPVAALAGVAVAAGAVLAAATSTAGAPGVVSAARTGWLWAAVVSGLLAAVGTLLWLAPSRAGRRDDASPRRTDGSPGDAMRAPGPGERHTPAPEAELERRRDAEDWRALSEGRDPTAPEDDTPPGRPAEG